ncbi:MAG: polysaccharide biosynthesis tyrosine autokinase [Gemmatales bacterium]
MNRPELLEGMPQPQVLDGTNLQQEPAQQSNIYRIAWQRKSLIILGLILAIVIGILYYSQKDPVYQSQSMLAVQRKNPPILGGDLRGAYMMNDDYLTTHATLLRTPMILRKVAEDTDIKKLETFAGKDLSSIVGILGAGLMVVRDNRDNNTRSPVLQLTFKGPIASDCQTIIYGIIKHYKEYLKDNTQSQTSELLNSIKRAETYMRLDYDKLDKDHKAFMEQNPAIVSSSADGKNPLFSRLSMLEGLRIKTMEQRYDVQSRLETLNKGIENGMGRSLISIFSSSNIVRPGMENSSPVAIGSTSERVMQLELLEKTLETRLGKNHPELKDIRLQLESLQNHMAKQTQELNDLKKVSPKDDIGSVRETPIQTIVNSLKLELMRYDSILKTLDTEVARERDYIKESAKNEVQNTDFVERKKALLKVATTLTEQLNNTKFQKDEVTYSAEIWAEPTLPIKVEPRLFVIMVLSTVFGLLGGFGLAYLADMTDKSFRSPEEIRRRLNIPVVGHIPVLISEEEAAKLEGAINGPDPSLVTYYRPKSRKSEVFRGIRTALYFSTRGEGHKVIQITSPNMGDGKTTLSSNLAVSIAQSGKQTILIDGDFRRPRLHKVFAVPSEKGFASVIMGQSDLRDAIQPTVIPGLSILPCGPIPPNPAELLTSPRFKELMDELREQYDYVLIDTPPLLVVTDPCVVAPRVDGVLMTMRVTKNGRPIAERARDILVSLGAKPLGIVVNGVSMQGPSGYGYGGGYGYGYGYGQYDYAQAYQYKYDYSDRYYAGYGDEGYYQDRDATEITPQMPTGDAGTSNRLPSDANEPAGK